VATGGIFSTFVMTTGAFGLNSPTSSAQGSSSQDAEAGKSAGPDVFPFAVNESFDVSHAAEAEKSPGSETCPNIETSFDLTLLSSVRTVVFDWANTSGFEVTSPGVLLLLPRPFSDALVSGTLVVGLSEGLLLLPPPFFSDALLSGKMPLVDLTEDLLLLPLRSDTLLSGEMPLLVVDLSEDLLLLLRCTLLLLPRPFFFFSDGFVSGGTLLVDFSDLLQVDFSDLLLTLLSSSLPLVALALLLLLRRFFTTGACVSGGSNMPLRLPRRLMGFLIIGPLISLGSAPPLPLMLARRFNTLLRISANVLPVKWDKSPVARHGVEDVPFSLATIPTSSAWVVVVVVVVVATGAGKPKLALTRLAFSILGVPGSIFDILARRWPLIPGTLVLPLTDESSSVLPVILLLRLLRLLMLDFSDPAEVSSLFFFLRELSAELENKLRSDFAL
jgi:hypothetical protein